MALLKKRQVDLKISPPETPKRAHRYATIITTETFPTPAHVPSAHSGYKP